MNVSGNIFLSAVMKLPSVETLAFKARVPGESLGRGFPTVISDGPINTSRDVRFASENFTFKNLYAIATRNAKDLSTYSNHPEESELYLPPDTVLVEVGEVSAGGVHVLVVEEIVVSRDAFPLEWDSTEALLLDVSQRILDALDQPPVTVTSPGKFTQRQL